MREGLRKPPLVVDTSAAAVSACQLREGCVNGTFVPPTHPPLSFLLSTFSLVRGLSLSCPVSRVFYTRPQRPRSSLQDNTTTARVEGSKPPSSRVWSLKPTEGSIPQLLQLQCSPGAKAVAVGAVCRSHETRERTNTGLGQAKR